MADNRTIYTILTTDSTVGTVTMDREPYENEQVVIHLRDENGNSIWVTKRVKAILSEEATWN